MVLKVKNVKKKIVCDYEVGVEWEVVRMKLTWE